ncbi:hypothetical protein A3850_011705 [Lewinella sp. 4G2]|nr:hypothetical protein A3850_011705 [Lewinella sp. 4G2]
MYLFSYFNEEWDVISKWTVREDDLNGHDHVTRGDNFGEIEIRTLDFEAIVHDTVIKLKDFDSRNLPFEIKK